MDTSWWRGMKVAVYDGDTNSMIEAGWIRPGDIEGWTAANFDWDKYIRERAEE